MGGDFVGRRQELDGLDQALGRVADGHSRVVLVGGEAGIGKTRLVEEFVARTRGRSGRVLWGGCIGLGGLPYGPVAEALRSLVHDVDDEYLTTLIGPHAADLARILPGLEDRVPGAVLPVMAGEELAQPRLFDTILGLVDRLAEDAAVVWVAEDLHWADPSTLDLLAFLARNARSSRVLFILTFRSDELHRRHPLVPWLAEIGRLGAAERIELRRFDRDEIGELVAVLRRAAPNHDVVETVADRSGGIPLFVEELVAASEFASLDRVPATLRDVILARTERLSPATKSVLQAASVGGLRVDASLVAGVLELPESTIEEALGEALENHVLAYTPGSRETIEFRHPLIREAVYDDLLPGRRRRLHAAFAATLRRLGEPRDSEAAAWWGQLADHGEAANDHGIVFPASVRAGEASMTASAYGDAARRYARALELWDVVADAPALAGMDRADLLHRAATATMQSGDPPRAAALLTEAAEAIDRSADPLRASRVLTALSWAMRAQCDIPNLSLPIAREALDLVPAEPPSVERAMALSELGGTLMNLNRWEESAVACEEAVEVARAVGDVTTEALALGRLATDLASLGRLDAAVDVGERVRRIARERRDPLTLAAYGNLFWVFECRRDYAGLAAHGMEVAALARDAGAWAFEGVLQMFHVFESHWTTGRWPEARGVLDQIGERDCTDRTREVIRNVYCALLDVGQGRLDEARIHLDQVTPGEWNMYWLARVLLAAGTRSEDEALELVAECHRRGDPATSLGIRGDVALAGLRVLAGRAVAARSIGDEVAVATATRHASPLVDVVRETGLPRVAPGTDPLRVAQVAAADAELTRLAARPDAAAWGLAIERAAAIDRHPEIAYLSLRQAEAYLTDGGRRRDAEGPLREAARLAFGMGADPMIAEIRGLAKRARIAVAGEEPDRTVPAVGPGAVEALTRREREVLALIAQGRTNRQIGDALFISESTAGVHVSHILGKLGVTGRAEAAAAAVRMGVASD